jgi:hypothetical protein
MQRRQATKRVTRIKMEGTVKDLPLKTVAGLLLAGGVVAAGPAQSHHSFAMFDRTKEVTLAGTVKAFQWTNPHSWLQLDARTAKGTAEWSVELGSPNTLVRQGWRKNSFKTGDRVTVTINPMRDGSNGGAFVAAVNAAGKKLP